MSTTEKSVSGYDYVDRKPSGLGMTSQYRTLVDARFRNLMEGKADLGIAEAYKADIRSLPETYRLRLDGALHRLFFDEKPPA